MNHEYHFDAALSEENKREAREMQEKLDARKRVEDAAPVLLAACEAQHQAIDTLFAWLIKQDTGFLPSMSGQPWDAIKQGNDAIEKALK